MKHKLGKLMSALLCLALLFGALPLTALLGLALDADPWFISLAIQMESFVKCPICLWRIRSKKWIHDVTLPEGEK